MKRCIPVIVFLQLGVIASSQQLQPEAPWTQEEYDSIKSAIDGCIDVTQAWKASIEGWGNDGQPADTNRGVVSTASNDFAYASFYCHEAIMHVFGAQQKKPLDRPTQVSHVKQNINFAMARLDAANDLPALASFDTARNVAASALSKLSAFDQSLDYPSWQPTYYPTLVGFHGDYDYSFKRLRHASRYIGHMMSNVSRMLFPSITPVFTEEARQEISKAAGKLWKAEAATFRAAGLEGLVFLDDDWAKLQIDVGAARTQGRTVIFFKSVLALEYINGAPGPSSPAHFSGRAKVPYAATGALGAFWLDWQRAISGPNGLAIINTAAWGRDQLLRLGPVTIGNTLSPYSEMASDGFDQWVGLDNYNWGVMGFFHGVTTPPAPPPPGPGCPVFVPTIVLLDGVTAQAQCLQQ